MKLPDNDCGGLCAFGYRHGVRAACCRAGAAFDTCTACGAIVFPGAAEVARLGVVRGAAFLAGFALSLANPGDAGLIDACRLVVPLAFAVARLWPLVRAARCAFFADAADAFKAAERAGLACLPFAFGAALLGDIRPNAPLRVRFAYPDAFHGVRIASADRAGWFPELPLILLVADARRVVDAPFIPDFAATFPADASVAFFALG